MINKKRLKDQGFTLVELLVAMAISLVIMAAIFNTFTTQQDTYVVQTQVSAMQQNLRAALYMMTRDIQMAGYYTNFDTKTYSDDFDWDPTTTDSESTRPVLYGRDNDGISPDVKDGTDVIVIIKASNDDGDKWELDGDNNESASSGSITLSDNHLGFNSGDFGILAKKDLSRSEIFKIDSVISGNITLENELEEGYGDEDLLFTADIIVYYIDDTDSDHPSLKRGNHGKGGGSDQIIAENVENLQIQYYLSTDETVTEVTGGEGSNVRAVEIALLARTDNTIRDYTFTKDYNLDWADLDVNPDGYQRRLLHSTIKTRNIGL